MLDKSPEQLAQEDAKRAAITLGRWLLDHGRRYLTLSLLKLVVVGAVAVVIGMIALPVLAVAACAVVVVLALGYAVYSQKLLHDERERRNWTFVASKRVQQQNLDAEQRVDEAVLVILGKPEDRELTARARPPELAQALRLVRHQLAEAHAGQHSQPPSAAVRRGAAPQEPDLKVVRARIAQRKVERDALEAEIQSLAAPEDIAAAILAEEARVRATSAGDSARRATQAARERKRRGQSATQSDAGISLELAMRPNGARNVRKVPPRLTPEQIAQGLTEPPGGTAG